MVDITERLRLNSTDWIFGDTATTAMKEIIALRQRVQELEKEQVAWRKFTERANNTVSAAEAERDSAYKIADHHRAERDELLEVVETAYKVASEHDDRLPFDWAVYCEMLYQTIASVNEK